MAETNKIKNPSPLVQTVLKLDNYFSEMIRLGNKIETMDIKSNFDFEQAERLISHFAECGEGVSMEVLQMSQALTDFRAQADAAVRVVATYADLVQARKNEQAQKMEEFRLLGEKVRELTVSLASFKFQENEFLTDEERAKLTGRLDEFKEHLLPLIEEAQDLKKEGQKSKFKALEQGADSLGQRLHAVKQKIDSVEVIR